MCMYNRTLNMQLSGIGINHEVRKILILVFSVMDGTGHESEFGMNNVERNALKIFDLICVANFAVWNLRNFHVNIFQAYNMLRALNYCRLFVGDKCISFFFFYC